MVERPCETNDWEWIVLMGSGGVCVLTTCALFCVSKICSLCMWLGVVCVCVCVCAL